MNNNSKLPVWRIVLFCFVVGAIICGGVYFFWYKGIYSKSYAPTSTSSISLEQINPTSEDNLVTIKNFTFSPKTIKIKVGQIVTWQNNDESTHSLQSDQFSSQPLNQNDKFQYTFDQPGTYNYFCSLHSNMKGTVIVE